MPTIIKTAYALVLRSNRTCYACFPALLGCWLELLSLILAAFLLRLLPRLLRFYLLLN
jgi:hypothetical protein